MSITIFVCNDDDPTVEKWDCCNDPRCFDCKGTGIIVIPAPKHSINLGNRNFSTLWHALGLDPNSYNITPAALREALVKFNPELAVHKNSTSDGHAKEGETTHNYVSALDGSARMISLGWPIESIRMRVQQLLEMCDYAAKKEEFIAWG